MGCETECLDEVELENTGSIGAQIVDIGSIDEPIEITTVIALPSTFYPRIRIFITCSTDVLNPIIQNGVGTQEVFLYYVQGAGSLEIDSQANLKLTGSWEPNDDGMLSLQWVPDVKFTEVNRNEMS